MRIHTRPASSSAARRGASGIAPSTLVRALRPSGPNGRVDRADRATAMAAASPGVKVSGGRVAARSSTYPPPGPAVDQIGVPACCRALMSRLTVRDGDLEPLGQPRRRPGLPVGRPQLLGQGVEPIGPVHTAKW